MSKDALLAHACPHFIRYERASIVGEREIITRSPISSSNLLLLRFNGEEIPKEGLLLASETVFPSSAPYRFTNDTATLSVSSDGVEKAISFPTSKIFTQQEVVLFLNKNLPFPIFAEPYESSIKLTNQKNSSGLVLKGSSLKKLGYKTSKISIKNKKTVGAWNLAKLFGGGFKVFFKEEEYFKGVVDISYLTEKRFCRRCVSTGVENDFRFNTKGEIETIQDHNLLYQSLSKMLLTEITSNPYHNWYGSNAMTLIGRKVSASVVQSLRGSVRDALTTFKSVQDRQASIQSMSLKERLRRVVGIDVSTIGEDETSYLVSIVAESMSSEEVNINIIFAVPGSFSLDGDLT
jgi:phage baseplate assembly protein W